MEIKKCFKCNKEKEINEFYIHKKMADKHFGKCKKCAKKDVSQHRFKNIDKIREYDRERAKLPHRIKLRAINTKRRRKEIKGYQSSHNHVVRAIKNGILKKPKNCEMCNCIKKIVGHHPNYNEPLKVIWVCSVCYSQIHKKGGGEIKWKKD